jgi:predicted nucleic acid-binding protein
LKLLADSCVWSFALRRQYSSALSAEQAEAKAALADAIVEGRVVTIGPIRQEVLSGVRHEEQFERLEKALDAFPDEPIAAARYVEAARLFNLCRSQGIECGPVDMPLCAVALFGGWDVLTTDRGLRECLALCRSQTG